MRDRLIFFALGNLAGVLWSGAWLWAWIGRSLGAQ
jgi:hypothetical protein